MPNTKLYTLESAQANTEIPSQRPGGRTVWRGHQRSLPPEVPTVRPGRPRPYTEDKDR